MVQTMNEIKMDKAKSFWDKQANKYDNIEKQFDPFYKEIISTTESYFDANDVVLDFGCATGTKALTFAKSVKQIYGLDISPQMIQIAAEKANEMNIKNAEFASGTIFDQNFSAIKFDKITAFSIIHLLDNIEDVINKIHEMLKPGGIFISTTACFKDKMQLKTKIGFFLNSIMIKLGLFPLHLNMFTATDVGNLFDPAKFEILKAERILHGMTISFIIAKKI